MEAEEKTSAQRPSYDDLLKENQLYKKENFVILHEEILEMVATGAPLPKVLRAVCLMVEDLLPNSGCSIFLLDKTGSKLRTGAGPNLPKAYLDAVEGEEISEFAGSCGTAAFLGKQVIVEDVFIDPRWVKYRQLAKESNIRACWSTPFFGKNGRVLGTFAISYRYKMKPEAFHIALMEKSAHLVSIAVEHQRHEDLLIQTQKLESLGVMAGGIAHDFNNVLVAILGQTSLALRKIESDHIAKRHIQKAISATEHAKELTKQMLAYSGRSLFKTEALSINDIVLGSRQLAGLAIAKNIDVILNLGQNLPVLQGDPTQIQQVVLNLLLNASESFDGADGKIEITTKEYLLSEPNSSYSEFTNQELMHDSYVWLEIKDNGRGMSPATLSRIFDPFYSTKESGHGLGLSAVLGIVRGHNGGISVVSQPNVGTTFKLILPVCPLGKSPISYDDEPIQKKQLNYTVLVIDDELHVRETVKDMLEFEGINVVPASNGLKGIEIFDANRERIDLVILDLSMPGLSGEKTLAELKRLDSSVKVLLSSGYSELEVAQKFSNGDILGFIQKPYQVEFLLQEVTRCLDH